MRHPYRQMDEVFYTIVNDAISGGCTVLVFVAALPGALAATHTFLVRGQAVLANQTRDAALTRALAGAAPMPCCGLQELLRQEFVQYKLVPIFGYDDLIRANDELVAGNTEVRLPKTAIACA